MIEACRRPERGCPEKNGVHWFSQQSSNFLHSYPHPHFCLPTLWGSKELTEIREANEICYAIGPPNLECCKACTHWGGCKERWRGRRGGHRNKGADQAASCWAGSQLGVCSGGTGALLPQLPCCRILGWPVAWLGTSGSHLLHLSA